MLPITHFLYLGVISWLVGIALVVRAKTTRAMAVGGLWCMGSVPFVWLAFARYWGDATGVVAGVITLMFMSSQFAVIVSARGPTRPAMRRQLLADAAWMLALVSTALMMLFAQPRVASVVPTEPFGVGGLRPQLQPVGPLSP